eukprot:TRINITY_DN1296_c0_g2_i3.p2 TRINITY_DN1296_c0_g2~~TRINITY_DN1296_c0_g2_i3.p2  ORF type:complete len:199 (+),score=25.88 TRINITY_DN1296_c0_g2_i3:1397-1993(+)
MNFLPFPHQRTISHHSHAPTCRPTNRLTIRPLFPQCVFSLSHFFSPLSHFFSVSTMKLSNSVSSKRRKQRKNHFSAPSSTRRKIMTAALNKANRGQYGVKRAPIRTDDVVQIVRGEHKGKEAKVLAVYRKKFVIHLERTTRNKVNQQPINIGIHPSSVQIVKLKMTHDRQLMFDRMKANKEAAKGKGKYTEAETAEVD